MAWDLAAELNFSATSSLNFSATRCGGRAAAMDASGSPYRPGKIILNWVEKSKLEG